MDTDKTLKEGVETSSKRVKEIKKKLHNLYKLRKALFISAEEYKREWIPLVNERNRLLGNVTIVKAIK